MDPSLFNYAGPSTYRPQPNQQHPAHPQQSQASRPHLPSHPSQSGQIPPYPAQSSTFPKSTHPSSTHPSSPSTPNSRGPHSKQSPPRDSSNPSNPPTQANSSDPLDSHLPSDAASRTSGNGIATGPLVEPHQDLNDFLENFWARQMSTVEKEEQDGKVNVSLPLARIKKVMKSDEDVKMISAEVPIMFSKACEVFISELTCRAWLIAESHKRRTLQRSDVAAAIAHSDMFDFLIDIVPRDGEGADAADVGEGDDGVETRTHSVGDGEEMDGYDAGDGVDGVDGGDGAEDGEDEGEEMYREYVEGDE